MSAKAPVVLLDRHRMNRGERQYAAHLDAQKAAGTVAAWWFEGITLRLADATHYRADFLVHLSDGTLEIHEVKGRKGKRFFATEDAWLKLKIVARAFPFPVRVVWPASSGGWDSEAVPPTEPAPAMPIAGVSRAVSRTFSVRRYRSGDQDTNVRQ